MEMGDQYTMTRPTQISKGQALKPRGRRRKRSISPTRNAVFSSYGLSPDEDGAVCTVSSDTRLNQNSSARGSPDSSDPAEQGSLPHHRLTPHPTALLSSTLPDSLQTPAHRNNKVGFNNSVGCCEIIKRMGDTRTEKSKF